MKVLKKVTKTVETEEIKDILCNNCGESCFREYNALGLIETEVCGGYYSVELEDMKTYTFSICEKCLVELFKQFNIKPQIDDYYI